MNVNQSVVAAWAMVLRKQFCGSNGTRPPLRVAGSRHCYAMVTVSRSGLVLPSPWATLAAWDAGVTERHGAGPGVGHSKGARGLVFGLARGPRPPHLVPRAFHGRPAWGPSRRRPSAVGPSIIHRLDGGCKLDMALAQHCKWIACGTDGLGGKGCTRMRPKLHLPVFGHWHAFRVTGFMA